MTGFKRTYVDCVGIVHIVAMPTCARPFSACGKWHMAPTDVRDLAVVTCLACWAREFLEYQIEAIRGRIDNALGIPPGFLR